MKAWHVTITKFQNLLIRQTINRAMVVPNVVVVYNEEGFFN